MVMLHAVVSELSVSSDELINDLPKGLIHSNEQTKANRCLKRLLCNNPFLVLKGIFFLFCLTYSKQQSEELTL